MTDMNIQTMGTRICILAILAMSILSACGPKAKKGQVADGSYTIKAGDTITDAKTILAKVDAMVAVNRLDDATNFISVNLHRFHGEDRAQLLNARGGAYYLKDDLEHAVADYLAATDIEPENPTYLVNVANTYENMESLTNATYFAKKVLDLKTASDSDKAVATQLIQRCDRIHQGQ